MKAVLPDNFKLKNHLQQYPPHQYRIKKFNEDHALYLLSQIILAPAQDQKLLDQMDWQTNFVPLYSNLLQAHVQEYKQYMTYFVQTQVIDCDNQYIRKVDRRGEEKSKGYRYKAPYRAADVQTIAYSSKFLNVLRKKQQRYVKKFQGEYGHLLKWLWPVNQLSINFQVGLKLAVAKRDYYLKYPELQKKKLNKKTGLLKPKDTLAQYKYTKANLFNAHRSYTPIEVDESGQRLHTVLTSMPKEQRNLLTYQGEHLISFDIKNSQPYFITALFNRSMYTKSRNGVSIFTVNKNLLSKLPADLGQSEEFFEAFGHSDVVKYKSLVSNIDGNTSDLYLYMWAEFETQGIHFANRDEVKEVMYEVIFTANRYGTAIKKHFSSLFPTIDKLLRHIKQIDKAVLPCLLQSIESHVVLKVITKRMAKQYPKAPLFTIHDSIATTEPYADRLKSIMEDELTKFTGLPPKLSEELWHPRKAEELIEKYTV